VIWGEIDSGTYMFNKAELLSAALSGVTTIDLSNFFDKYIKEGSPYKTKFSTRFYGANALFPATTASVGGSADRRVITIQDPIRFKKMSNLKSVRDFSDVAISTFSI
jgi:hypothetical protein